MYDAGPHLALGRASATCGGISDLGHPVWRVHQTLCSDRDSALELVHHGALRALLTLACRMGFDTCGHPARAEEAVDGGFTAG